MPPPILATKLYLPPPGPKIVTRPRLTERLDAGLQPGSARKLTLVSAPAGFGKTTLLSEWLAGCGRPAAWLSLDEGDNAPPRFLTYLAAALQKIAPDAGAGVLALLQTPQPPPAEILLTALLNDIAAIPHGFVLVLDDYHVIDSQPVDQALTFLLEHLPPQMHLVIATREDPRLPLPRLRARGQLTELRLADLRFSLAEAAEFLHRGMGLDLTPEDIAALETRTEGWIAGLQLAALALQGLALQNPAPSGVMPVAGHPDASGFIRSFTGSHHFVLDYLVTEVLEQQPESIQAFLLRTSILDRLCGPLCDAVMQSSSGSGQETLAYLERANLFLAPLDNERRWYRYHHLFTDLLRQRLPHSLSSPGDVSALHGRASQWYEDSGMDIEAFQHAVAGQDIDRAARLVEGGGKPQGLPLQFRGGLLPVLSWLEALPAAELDARPALWVMAASATSMVGRLEAVEDKLQKAEAALQANMPADMPAAGPDEYTRNLIGHIAAIRALLAAAQNRPDEIIAQSQRALEYLHPQNLAVRTATIWKLGIAYQLQGERAAALRAYSEAASISRATGNFIIHISATIGRGAILESEIRLPEAALTYDRLIEQAGALPQPGISEAHLGLARIHYEWNDLDAAEQSAQQGIRLAQQTGNFGPFAPGEVTLARVNLARGEAAAAAAILAQAGENAAWRSEFFPMTVIAGTEILILLSQGNVAAAARLAEQHALPLSQARVYLAQEDPFAALAALESLRLQAELRNWPDERLRAMLLQALALDALGERDRALRVLGEALALAEPGGMIRTFLDEGAPMAELLSAAAAFAAGSATSMPEYAAKLLARFPTGLPLITAAPSHTSAQPLIEPLTGRELEVLRLIAQGLSNREIGERLFLALSTVKGHSRVIYAKLQVQRRTEAVARARELGLL